MYAIISLAGQQFRVEPGTVIQTNRLEAEPGATLTLADSVLLVKDESGLRTGTPTVAGARVEIEVLKHLRGPKLIVFKMKRRKDYRKKNGHRAQFTEVEVKQVIA